MEQKFVITTKGVLDIISKIGGYAASFGPALRITTPLFVLYFFHMMYRVLNSIKKQQLFNKAFIFLKTAKTKISLILEDLTWDLGEDVVNQTKEVV